MRYRDFAAAGLSPRRVDHWTRAGYLRADNPNPGYGAPRTWPDTELQVAKVMLRLVEAGIRPDAAARAARNNGQLAPGVCVRVDPQTTEAGAA